MKQTTRLRRLRRDAGYTSCTQLAAVLGVSPICVHFWEVGPTRRPYRRNAAKLEALFRLPIATLLEPESEKVGTEVPTPDSAKNPTPTQKVALA